MTRPPDGRSPRSDDVDPFGMDEAKQSLWSRSFGLVLPGDAQSMVPISVATRGLSVTVRTDRQVISPGESVRITIELSNRLPVGISVPIKGKQPWGWRVDGLEAAREEPRFSSDVRTELALDGREKRSYTREWGGSFRRNTDPVRWVDADAGSYEITGYVPADTGELSDTTEIEVR